MLRANTVLLKHAAASGRQFIEIRLQTIGDGEITTLNIATISEHIGTTGALLFRRAHVRSAVVCERSGRQHRERKYQNCKTSAHACVLCLFSTN